MRTEYLESNSGRPRVCVKVMIAKVQPELKMFKRDRVHNYSMWTRAACGKAK
jgi:hypothetical protein